MAILLTGATGFLGSYLARTLLARGERVRALRRSGSDLSLLGSDAGRIDWFQADLFDPLGLEDALQGIDTVYHCAALVSFDPREREAMMKVNAEGTANMVNASLDAGVRCFLHVSSVAAVGRRKGNELIVEANDWEKNKMTTDYSLSKHLAEREAWRGWAEGLPVIIVNPGTILGAGFWSRGTARFFSRADEGLRFYTQGATGFVDVRDVAAVCIHLVRKGLFGERFLLVGENLPYRDLFSGICQALDRPQPSVLAGPGMLEAVWRWEALKAALTGGKPDLTRQNARIIGNSFRYDNRKVIAATGMTFRSTVQTIAETALAYRQSKTTRQPFGLLEPDIL